MFKYTRKVLISLLSVVLLMSFASSMVYAMDVMEMTTISPQFISPSEVSPLSASSVETHYITKNNVYVGSGTFEYYYDGAAYGSCEVLSNDYTHAYCRLTSYQFNTAIGLYESIAVDFAYTAGITYAALSPNELGTTINGYPPYVQCTWIVYKPTVNGTIPSGSPSTGYAFYK